MLVQRDLYLVRVYGTAVSFSYEGYFLTVPTVAEVVESIKLKAMLSDIKFKEGYAKLAEVVTVLAHGKCLPPVKEDDVSHDDVTVAGVKLGSVTINHLCVEERS